MSNLPLAGLRILIVEDVTAIRKLVSTLIQRQGCNDVFDAADSETAWHHLKRQQFDAVLLDYELKSDDGVSLAWRIRSDKALVNCDVPIIFLTSHDEAVIVEAARKADVDAYLVKPVMPDVLGRRIIEAIKHRHGSVRQVPRSTEVSWRD